uniref:Sin3 histone deacetylase corepressor complex component SDS3 n=1 Tax=Acrobeloides nanus TaxID=290746 RepID=A0A914CYZ9_9BILA
MNTESLLSDVIFDERMKPLLEEKEHLENGTHPDFVVGLKKLETEYEEELGKIANREMLEKERIEAVYQHEKKAIEKEYENKLNELVEILSNECEEKKRQVEAEINSLDINTATNLNYYNYVYANKKTLRRRANEPPQVGEKRSRKRSPQNIVHLLPETDIAQDVKFICNTLNTTATTSLEDEEKQPRKISVENNKLTCDGKVYHKGQNVTVETVNYGKFPAIIHTVCERFVHFKSTMAGDTRQVMATKDDLECSRVIVRKRY